MGNDENNIFGVLAYSYTREMALSDGVLVHVPNAVYKYHTAVTDTVFGHIGEERIGEFVAASVLNQFKTWNEGALFRFDTETYKVVCGPSDDLRPCITIMFEHED